jgi:hypothetical protein
MVFAMDELVYAHEERWENDSTPDSHLVLRETPAWKVRSNWATIQAFLYDKKLKDEMMLAHHIENYDNQLEPLPPKPLESKFWRDFKTLYEQAGLWFCLAFHRPPMYSHGDLYSTCYCGRKFAVAWADQSKVPAGVYTQVPFVMPTERTIQPEVRGAHATLVSNAR